ncbi:hypothetical protein BDV98DRAFT_210414 [Pterulicium gracile]|uniref:Uncharacterized protein n=1 Tax=Pterulicium gracile TaxID=1884261 RepID=A0A5C3QJ46_9AGAR|nr:hypothetical protein BDV98DRAFT_210414 [Pterula gracilis]
MAQVGRAGLRSLEMPNPLHPDAFQRIATSYADHDRAFRDVGSITLTYSSYRVVVHLRNTSYRAVLRAAV